jgi:23S rRNA (adenine2503-C2)-methyltransferase
MGEPLANFSNLTHAIESLMRRGARHRGPTLPFDQRFGAELKLADEPLQIRLAISLHAATNEVRNQTMPVNRSNIETLLSADYYAAGRNSGHV